MKAWDYVLSGVIFGAGLQISGMTRPEVVLSFLRLEDLGLALVMGAGILVTLIGFFLVPRLMDKSVRGQPFHLRTQRVDRNLVIGSIIFGVGWGIAGVCPGAGIASLGAGNWPILIAFVGMILGTYAFGWWAHAVMRDRYG